jgi:hypothetical protein
MATPNQEAIDTFISITGASDAVALQKLEEHRGDLNQAVNAYFSEGDRNVYDISISLMIILLSFSLANLSIFLRCYALCVEYVKRRLMMMMKWI